MVSRITLCMSAEGELQILLNPEGRDQLVRELQQLSEKNDHFHMGPDRSWEVPLSTRAYNSTDKLVLYGKVLFRPDSWDRAHFPHVLDEHD